MINSGDNTTRRMFGHTTMVNKKALAAWLEAWANGSSFPVRSSINFTVPSQFAKDHLARLRQVRSKGVDSTDSQSL